MEKQKSKNSFFCAFKKGLLLFLVCQLVLLFGVSASCQSKISFTATDVFEIPENNSSIRFATNGTYEHAILTNNTWIFKGLQFSVDVYRVQKIDLSFSSRDCNVTAFPFFMFIRSSESDIVTRIFFSYTVEGKGTQSVNLGYDLQQGQIEAILDGEWIGLNHGWTRSADGTITVTAPVSNVSISFYGYPASYLDEPDLFEDHSVVIGSTFSLTILVSLTTIFRHKKTKREN